METAQERELQQMQAWWPLDTMACSFDLSNSYFLFEWDPQLRYFDLGVVGVGAAGDPDDHTHEHEHELELFFPKCMESPASEASAAATGLLTAEDETAVMPEDQLDALLQNFWDSDEEQLVGFNSSCVLKEKSGTTAFLDDDLLALSSVSPTGPTLPEKTVGKQPQAEQPPGSSSSHCDVDPQASNTGSAQRQTARTNRSFKRSPTPEETDTWSSSRRRKASSTARSSVVYPFTVVKPCGVDGSPTLADINERILTPPARPVRHPVGRSLAPRACRTATGQPRRAKRSPASPGCTPLGGAP